MCGIEERRKLGSLASMTPTLCILGGCNGAGKAGEEGGVMVQGVCRFAFERPPFQWSYLGSAWRVKKASSCRARSAWMSAVPG
jgi:hypothetical protein